MSGYRLRLVLYPSKNRPLPPSRGRAPRWGALPGGSVPADGHKPSACPSHHRKVAAAQAGRCLTRPPPPCRYPGVRSTGGLSLGSCAGVLGARHHGRCRSTGFRMGSPVRQLAGRRGSTTRVVLREGLYAVASVHDSRRSAGPCAVRSSSPVSHRFISNHGCGVTA